MTLMAMHWLGAALLLGSISVSSVAALGTNYEHNAETTYCWAIPRRTDETTLTEDDRTTAYSGPTACPMEMKIILPNDTLRVLDSVTVEWSVTANFGRGRAINNTRLYYGRDSTNKLAQIVHSNVHSCVFGTGCDPFDDGKELVDKTVNKVANFTDNLIVFSDTLRFPTAGEFSVLAHIILPDFNTSSRFDYAVYTKVTVLESTAAPPVTAAPTQPATIPTIAPENNNSNKGKDDSGLSSGATIGIVIGGIAVVAALIVGVILVRRRKNNSNGANHLTGGYAPAPAYDANGGDGTGFGGSRGSKQNRDVTMTNSTAGFDSAWAGPGPNGSLDNTNHSSVSYQYATSSHHNGSDSYGRPSDSSGAFANAMHQQQQQQQPQYQDTSATHQGGRKKRIDSDVEL